MKSVLLVLAVLILPSAALILSDSSEAAEETLSEGVFLVSYNSEAGTHFIVKETQSYCYKNLELYVLGSGTAIVRVDGVSSYVSLPSSGVVKLTYSWEPSSEHELEVSIGSNHYSYSLTVRKSVSISDIEDAEEFSDYVTVRQSEIDNQKLFAALAAFVASAVGLFLAFKLAQWRAANGSENL